MGALDNIPEAWKSRKTGEAITAPSAIVLAGAGAAAAILGGLPILAIAGIGALVYGARVATLLPRGKGKTRIDPMEIADPWRSFVRDALDAQRRYRRAVESTNTGPLQNRLIEIGERIDAGVDECWRIARRGDSLVDAINNLDVIGARKDLENAKREAKSSPGDSQKATVEAIQAQVDAADRLIKVARDAQDHVRLLNARLDEAVARAVELSLRAEDVGELGGLGTDVDQLVDEMESLRVALDDVGGTAQAAGAAG